MNNIMLDLETMSLSSSAAIIAIGMVKFKNNEILDTLYIPIGLESSIKVGCDIDPNTVIWWMNQSDRARHKITKAINYSISGGLMVANSFIGTEDRLWGNGAGFDNVILSNAYDKCGIAKPWKYYNDMCYRTLASLVPEILIERSGVYHNALDDAISQTNHLFKITDELGISI